jgi:hypothetical protein
MRGWDWEVGPRFMQSTEWFLSAHWTEISFLRPLCMVQSVSSTRLPALAWFR